MTIWRWTALAACLVIAAAVVVAPDPNPNIRSALAIHDYGHVAAFSLVTVLLAFTMSARSRPTFQDRLGMTALAAVAALALGAAVEIAQAINGMYADPWDVMRDGGGAFAAALILVAIDPAISARLRAVLASAAVFGALAFAYPVFTALADEARARSQFPVLASFDSSSDLSRFYFQKDSEPRISQMRGDDGQPIPGMKLHLPVGKYPGFGLKFFPENWLGLRALQLIIINVDATPIELTVRLDDAEYNHLLDLDDRFNQSFSILPGTNRIEISLAEVATAPRNRQFDLKRVRSLHVYAVNLRKPGNIFVGPIELLQ